MLLNTIFSIFFIIFFIVFYFKNNRLAIASVLLLLPLYIIRLSIFTIPTTLLELSIIGLSIGFFYKLIKNRNSMSFFGYFLLVFFLIIISIISTKISNESIKSLGILKSYIFEPIIYFIILINSFKTRKELEILIKFIGTSSLCLSIYAIFQKITGIGISETDPSWKIYSTRRVTSIFPYPNALGLFIAPIITIFLFRIIIKIQNNFKYLILSLKTLIFNILFDLIVFTTGLFAIIFARSSGALLGIIFSLVLYFFIIYKNKIRFILISSIIFILLISCPITYPIVNKNLLLGDFSGKIRIQMWKETYMMIKDNFILGGGLNNFKNTIKPYHEYTFFELYLYPHNIILNFWSELGFFGFLIFTIIVIKFFKNNYNIYNNTLDLFWNDKKNDKNNKIINYKKNTSIQLSLAMTTLIMHGLVDVPYFKNDLSILFWFIIAMSIINNKIDDNIIFVNDKI